MENFPLPQKWTTGSEQSVFRGYFQNPDYTHPELFLQDDAQVFADPQIKMVARRFDDKPSLATIEQIFTFLQREIPVKRDLLAPLFSTSAEEIFARRYATGCTERAICFAALSRQKGIPTVIVDSATGGWIQKGAPLRGMRGHFFVEMKLNQNWVLFDPTTGYLIKKYTPNHWIHQRGNAAFFMFAKALSVFDMGVGETEHCHFQREAFVGDQAKEARDRVFGRDAFTPQRPVETMLQPRTLGARLLEYLQRKHFH